MGVVFRRFKLLHLPLSRFHHGPSARIPPDSLTGRHAFTVYDVAVPVSDDFLAWRGMGSDSCDDEAGFIAEDTQNSAASCPSSKATIVSTGLTVGSSPYTSSHNGILHGLLHGHEQVMLPYRSLINQYMDSSVSGSVPGGWTLYSSRLATEMNAGACSSKV